MTSASLVLAAGVLSVFLSLLLVLALVGGITRERAEINRSLSAIRSLDARTSGLLAPPEAGFGQRVGAPTLAALTGVARRFLVSGQIERLDARLQAAGSPPDWDADRILAFKVLGLAAGAAVGLFAHLLFGGGGLGVSGVLSTLISMALGGAVGFFGPNLSLYQNVYNRREQLLRELPDAIDLLTISVEAGLAFDGALAQVARNTDGPLAEEFNRVLSEISIGRPRTAAMSAMADRTDLDDMRSFVNALLQADSFGIPMANVLRVQTREMRLKRSQRAEEAAQKVPVKILFPLIFFILPVLFIVVIGPAVINIVKNFG